MWTKRVNVCVRGLSNLISICARRMWSELFSQSQKNKFKKDLGNFWSLLYILHKASVCRIICCLSGFNRRYHSQDIWNLAQSVTENKNWILLLLYYHVFQWRTILWFPVFVVIKYSEHSCTLQGWTATSSGGSCCVTYYSIKPDTLSPWV